MIDFRTWNFKVPPGLNSTKMLIHSPSDASKIISIDYNNDEEEVHFYKTKSSIFIIRFIGPFKPGGREVALSNQNGCFEDTLQQNCICVIDTCKQFHDIFIEHTPSTKLSGKIKLNSSSNEQISGSRAQVMLGSRNDCSNRSQYNEMYNESKNFVENIIKTYYTSKNLSFISPSNTPLQTTLAVQSLNKIPNTYNNICLMCTYISEVINFLDSIDNSILQSDFERTAWFFHYFAFFYFYYSIDADKLGNGEFDKRFDKCQPSMYLRAGDCEDIALILSYVSDFIVRYKQKFKDIENFDKWLKSVCSGKYVVCCGNYDASSTQGASATHCVAYLHPVLEDEKTYKLNETHIIDASFNATLPLDGLILNSNENTMVPSVHQKHETITNLFKPSKRSIKIKNPNSPYEYFYDKGTVYKFELVGKDEYTLKKIHKVESSHPVVSNILAYQLPLNFRGDSLKIDNIMKSYKKSGLISHTKIAKKFTGNLHTQLGL